LRQSQKRLVYQRGAIERPLAAFPPQVARRQLLQFLVNQRNHRVQSFLVAGMHAAQKVGDLHGCKP